MSIDIEGDDMFFDSSEYFSSESESMCTNLEYDIWLKEPQSVKERKDTFLSRMGFSDFIESEVVVLDENTEAVLSPCSSSSSMDESLLSERRNSNSEANSSVDYAEQDWLDYLNADGEIYEKLVSGDAQNVKIVEKKKRKALRWWRSFTRSMNKSSDLGAHKEDKRINRMRMVSNQKKFMECTAVYTEQEINAHNGLIWTMKFSPDGQYLASGGEDGMVCIWRVSYIDAFCEPENCSFRSSQETECSSSPQKKRSISVVIPEKIFRIEETPVHKFHGHCADVLDLAWSSSNHLLSSSVDKTVCLWQVGNDKCLGVFHHNNYVTCVQFNPIDENYFISGSIDGKVRIWGVHNRRVEDWANAKDIVTAVCYQPNGKGFIVGCVSGTCRFYELSGDEFMLNAEINMDGKKKSYGNRITGIQFLRNDSQRVMITSEDSKIRILDGLEVVRKYKGLTKSGSQVSASFTSSGKHIISVGEDSRVYVWNYDDISIQRCKQPKSIKSQEHFISQGVTVALPWNSEENDINFDDTPSSLSNSERFSFGSWLSMEGGSSCTKTSITWPEEKLPLPVKKEEHGSRNLSSTWGLVFVTAHCDGTIRTFHNYGLPVRV